MGHEDKPGEPEASEKEKMLNEFLCPGRDSLKMEAVNTFPLFLFRQGKELICL